MRVSETDEVGEGVSRFGIMSRRGSVVSPITDSDGVLTSLDPALDSLLIYTTANSTCSTVSLVKVICFIARHSGKHMAMATVAKMKTRRLAST